MRESARATDDERNPGESAVEGSEDPDGCDPPAGPATRRRLARTGGTPAQPPACRNEVALVGRVGAAAEQRELPSGDVLVSWRLVVDRPPPRRSEAALARRPTVDTFDCAAFAAGVRRTALGFAAGDVVEVRGALRRRFWRVGAAVASRYEIEIASARRVWRPRPG